MLGGADRADTEEDAACNELLRRVRGAAALGVSDADCIIYQLSRSEKAKAEEVLPKVGGSLDVVNTDEITGWAWDSQQPDAPVQVEIYEGSTLLTKMAADQFREDLRQAGAGNGKHGFRFPTPARLKDGKPHLIRVKIAGVEGELDGSPKKL